MTLTGEHVEGLILAELDGDIDIGHRKAIASHVLQCSRCAAFRVEQRALHAAVAGSPVSSMELDRGHAVVWRRLAERPVGRARGFWQTARGTAVVAVTIALFAGAALAFGLTQGAARPDPSTVVIAQQDVALAPAAGTLTVRERLGPDRSRQVVVMADLRLAPAPTAGLLEIRAQQVGESYGVLATIPDLAGVSHARIEGAFPPLPAGASEQYDVWVHIEADGRVYESARIPLRITSDQTGMHARSD